MDALVLAGGKASPEFAAAAGVENRALAELTPGHTMLSFVLDALRGSKAIRRVFVVGEVPAGEGDALVAPGETLLDNLVLGIRAMGQDAGSHCLLVTSDIPFITPPAIDDFLEKAGMLSAGFCYPIIPMDIYNRQFAGMKRTTLKLREGEFTGGNIVLADPQYLLQNEAAVRGAYAARKSVLRLGSMLGWGLLLRIIVSQVAAPKLLSVSDLEAGISRLLGREGVARAVVTEYASLGTDVDKPEDIEVAKRLLSRLQSDETTAARSEA